MAFFPQYHDVDSELALVNILDNKGLLSYDSILDYIQSGVANARIGHSSPLQWRAATSRKPTSTKPSPRTPSTNGTSTRRGLHHLLVAHLAASAGLAML